jgi:beta-lactamase class A
MLREKFTATKSWAARHPRRFTAYFLGTVFGLVIIVQLLYPTSALVPFSSIENVKLGGVSKTEAIKTLDEKFTGSDVAVYLNNSNSAFLKANPGDLGITTSNKQRVQAINYPFFLRLVPTSLFWAHVFSDDVGELQYQRDVDKLAAFMTTTFGDTCQLEVRNATLEVKNSALQLVEAFSGGECNFEEVTAKLSAVQPTTKGAKVSISGNETKPTISTKQAEELAVHVTDIIKDGIEINDGKDTHKVPKEILRTWLDFGVVESKLDYSFNLQRSASYLGERIASLVEKPTGESVVTLRDFVEVSRDVGQSGVVFNQPAMLTSIKTSLEKGEDVVAVEVTTIQPTVKYNRTYSPDDAALNALIKKYANTHPGTYGVSFRELSGERRSASYRASTQYTTASTYKLFVAYSTLLRVESGVWRWSDQINGGRNLTECFEDMIQLSDNECAIALLKKVTVKSLTDEARAIGAVNTSFLVPLSIKSTAEDESLLLALLESGQILSQQSSRDIWITAMKKNSYRQGVPRGIPSAVVANKVGFLNAWLHDASIVYSPQGTYVLIIMTEYSSWPNIAELAGQIETLRTK